MYSELGAVGEVSGGRGVTNTEVMIGDIYGEFTAAVQVFSSSKQVSEGLEYEFCMISLYCFCCRTCSV